MTFGQSLGSYVDPEGFGRTPTWSLVLWVVVALVVAWFVSSAIGTKYHEPEAITAATSLAASVFKDDEKQPPRTVPGQFDTPKPPSVLDFGAFGVSDAVLIKTGLPLNVSKRDPYFDTTAEATSSDPPPVKRTIPYTIRGQPVIKDGAVVTSAGDIPSATCGGSLDSAPFPSRYGKVVGVGKDIVQGDEYSPAKFAGADTNQPDVPPTWSTPNLPGW